MNSYTPYTGKDESCLVQGESGLYYPGVRVENISFPLSISAIQSAVCSCLGNGDRPKKVHNLSSKSELFDQWVREFEMEILTEEPQDPNLFNPVRNSSMDIPAELRELTKKSVTIHSNFPVAALLDVGEGFIEGVNIETEIWSLGLCAERVAITRALAAGYTEFKSIHIYAPKGEFCSPCGACRQVLAEFMPTQTAVLHHGDGTLSKHNISQLLPFGFTSGTLKK